ncbi:hypothetical protein IF2G_09657 [Cordyceps javanica]|nr:hypothetical protein IF2G_09657 [Cordyceps javanica]
MRMLNPSKIGFGSLHSQTLLYYAVHQFPIVERIPSPPMNLDDIPNFLTPKLDPSRVFGQIDEHLAHEVCRVVYRARLDDAASALNVRAGISARFQESVHNGVKNRWPVPQRKRSVAHARRELLSHGMPLLVAE